MPNPTTVTANDEAAIARVPASTVPSGMVPTNADQAYRISAILAKSDLVPPEFRNKPANCFLAVSLGAEIGLAPAQAIQSIAVINGRPSLWGDGMLAVCLQSPHFEWIKETGTPGESATCQVKRKGWPEPTTVTFTMADARKAGLVDAKGNAARSRDGSGPWKSYPDRMMKFRARGFALRDTFADVLRGIRSAEEQRDLEVVVGDTVVNRETGEITEPDPAPPAPDPKPLPSTERVSEQQVAQLIKAGLGTGFPNTQAMASFLAQHFEDPELKTPEDVLAANYDRALDLLENPDAAAD